MIEAIERYSRAKLDHDLIVFNTRVNRVVSGGKCKNVGRMSAQLSEA